MERLRLSSPGSIRAEVKRSVLRGPNGGRRLGAGRPKGSKNRIKTLKFNDVHVAVLARPWTARVFRDACLLAFGTDNPHKPADRKLITRDPWLRLAVWKMILDRGWGRAPVEVKIEATQHVDVKYTREELAKLSLEQISQLWRDEIAAPAGLIEQPKPASD